MEKRGTIHYKLWTVMGETEMDVDYKITFQDETNFHIEMGFEYQDELNDDILDEMLQECLDDSQREKPSQMFDDYQFSVN